MKIDNIKKKLVLRLKKQPQVPFAYLHGSVLSIDNPRDIDIAVYLYSNAFDQLSSNGEISLSFAVPLEMDLEKLMPLPAGHEPFVRIVTPAGALSAGVPDSDKNPSRSSRLRGSIFFTNRPLHSRRQERKVNMRN